jgi:hypothetical protein
VLLMKDARRGGVRRRAIGAQTSIIGVGGIQAPRLPGRKRCRHVAADDIRMPAMKIWGERCAHGLLGLDSGALPSASLATVVAFRCGGISLDRQGTAALSQIVEGYKRGR